MDMKSLTMLQKIHGISTDLAKDKGIPLLEVLKYFIKDVQKSKLVIGHNILFDNNIIGSELLRMKMTNILSDFPCIDTKIYQLIIVQFQEERVVNINGQL